VPARLDERLVDRPVERLAARLRVPALLREAVAPARRRVEGAALRRRVAAPLRRRAGTSAVATAFARCAISFSRNVAMRCSSRRIARASEAVSRSPTFSANVWIAD
jgi:hypothetical protein